MLPAANNKVGPFSRYKLARLQQSYPIEVVKFNKFVGIPESSLTLAEDLYFCV